MLNRRGFIGSLAAALAAPAIVRAGSLMPVKALPIDRQIRLEFIAEMLSQANDLLDDVPHMPVVSRWYVNRTTYDIADLVPRKVVPVLLMPEDYVGKAAA